LIVWKWRKNVANKDIKHYLSLNYDFVVRKVEDNGEVIYKAFTKELDPLAFYGVGKTREESMQSLEEVIHELFPYYLEQGLEIPEPEVEDEVLPSGKFVVRTSPFTHKKLIGLAQKNKQSLNALVNSIFSQYTTSDALVESFTRVFDYSITARFEKMEKSWDQHLGESLMWALHLTVKEQNYAEEAAEAA